MKVEKLVSAAFVSTTLALAAPWAVAQTAGDGMQARHHAERHTQGERAFRLPSERVEARLAYIRTALKITDAQQSQWDTFATALRKQAREMDERIKARRAQAADQKRSASGVTAIERLERRQARLAAASARTTEILAAAKPLYAALTPEQQKIADEVIAPERRRMHRGHHRGHA
jgi:uncharacterized membrane protein YgaE (UPF0421/DUF939 family)